MLTRPRNTRVTFWTASGDSVFSFGEVGVDHIQPIWSHSGDYIAVGTRSDEGRFLFRMAQDGSDVMKLTGDEYSRINPVAWAPNDSKILAQASHAGTLNTRFLMVAADGSGVEDVTPFVGTKRFATSWRTN